MDKRELYQHVIDYFQKSMPVAETELKYRNPYELLVAVILSAQCTDKRVNMITPFFFERFPTVRELESATQEEVLKLIRSCSYPNNKAKNLIGMAKTLQTRFNGIVPENIDQLLELPGVGRKTANVIASVVYHKPAMAVDTHVYRVSARIGLVVDAKTPLETEKQLVASIPEQLLSIAHHWLILHGRYVCLARKPKCNDCGLSAFCQYYLKSQLSEV